MKKKKIVMFNPQASQTLAYDGPPLAILMACCLIDTEKFDIKIIDWHYQDFKQKLAKECKDADIFGVTCLSGFQIKGMIESVRIAKKANPKIKSVCGGWHPTFMPVQTLQCKDLDYVVMGQGPKVFKSLVNSIINNKSIENIKGIAYRNNGEIKINPPNEPEPVSNFPPIPYHLLDDPGFFLVGTKFAKKAAYILTSQGCPNNCGFCSEAAFYKRRWTSRSMPEIIKEIKYFIDNYHIDGLVISDSNFFVNEPRIADFCKHMIKLGIKWGGSAARPDSLARYSEDTWKLIRESGCGGIFIGTESANNKTLDVMNKNCKIEHTIKAIKMAKKYNIWIECPFIIGFPGTDIKKDFKINMAFINKYKDVASQFHMFVYTPFPGTGLLPKAIQQGYKVPEKLEGWENYALHAEGVTPWIPRKYSNITDQLSVYFQFLAGNMKKVVKTIVPPKFRLPALLAVRFLYATSKLRVKHNFFYLPLEYKVIKFFVKNRQLFFGKEKIAY